MMKRYVLYVLFMAVPLFLSARRLPMGEWRTHISYTDVRQVTQSADKVFGLSSGALFSVTKDDFLVEIYSKLTGLSDDGIEIIKYSPYENILFVGYSNSNIDLITEAGKVYNIPDIYRKSIVGSKKINDVSFFGKYAYVATDFGVVVLNMQKREISDTYYVGRGGVAERIIGVSRDENEIYALTPTSLLYAPTENTNLQNFNNWSEFGLPVSGVDNKSFLFTDRDKYLLKSDSLLYRYNGGNWSMKARGVVDIIYDNDVIFYIETEGNVLRAEGAITATGIDNNVMDAVYDRQSGVVWCASGSGVYRKDMATGEMNGFVPNGPASNYAWHFEYADGLVFSVPGGRWVDNYWRPGFVSVFDDGTWNVIPWHVLAAATPLNNCYDLVDVAVDPKDRKHFWVASYGVGLYEFRDNNLYKLHTFANSGVETIYPDGSDFNKYSYMRLDGLGYDKDGNLWFTNIGNSQIRYISPDGVFHSMPYAELAGLGTIQDIHFDETNQNRKYVLCPRYKNSTQSYLFVFDDKGTLENQRDDETRGFTSMFDQDGNSLNFTTDVLLRCITQDNNGVIWIGTTKGPILIENPKDIFKSDFNCTKVKIPRNDGTGLADFLLVTEEISDIKVDGANRKWIATKGSGVYLLSEDGLTTVHHFTAENSPLLSNTVEAIGINDRTGEVFFGTDKGTISYQSDAMDGGNSFKSVHAYPNPVRPEYTGPISIVGLTDKTSVRITDVNGNLVYETVSNGGVATWDGTYKGGTRVASGVYFAHCVSADRKNKEIAKILIIN